MKRALAIFALVAVLFLIAESQVRSAANGKHFRIPEAVPPQKVALLLGTGKWLPGGYENPMYRARVDAAAQLWLSGHADYILASGDNGTSGYDEPRDMTLDLVDRGVPFDAIYRDYAGFRTLDSVVRANRVFGLGRLIVVSQQFHNERALYLCRAAGIEAVAFDAPDVPLRYAARTAVRERFARLAAVLEVHFTPMHPRFLGPAIEIGGAAPAP